MVKDPGMTTLVGESSGCGGCACALDPTGAHAHPEPVWRRKRARLGRLPGASARRARTRPWTGPPDDWRHIPRLERDAHEAHHIRDRAGPVRPRPRPPLCSGPARLHPPATHRQKPPAEAPRGLPRAGWTQVDARTHPEVDPMSVCQRRRTARSGGTRPAETRLDQAHHRLTRARAGWQNAQCRASWPLSAPSKTPDWPPRHVLSSAFPSGLPSECRCPGAPYLPPSSNIYLHVSCQHHQSASHSRRARNCLTVKRSPGVTRHPWVDWNSRLPGNALGPGQRASAVPSSLPWWRSRVRTSHQNHVAPTQHHRKRPPTTSRLAALA